MKKNKIIFICILFILLIVTIQIIKSLKDEKEKKYQFILEYNINENCEEIENLYMETNDKKIYLICINNILVKQDQEPIYLKTLISNNNNILNEIYEMANKKIIYKDGGSAQYVYDNFVITKCNKEFGRKDILISKSIPDIDFVCQ